MNIDFSKSAHYTLSLRLSTDGFTFVVYNPMDGGETLRQDYAVNTQRSMAANVKGFLAEADDLKHAFRQVNIVVHTPRFTLMPLEYFEDEQMETFFYQNFKKESNEIVLCNVLGESNVVVLFGIDKLTHTFLSEQFPDARFFASVSPQIEFLSHKSRMGNNRKLYANLHPRSVEVLCMEKGRLVLCNSFATDSVDDACYYLLNVWQLQGYDQSHDELHLAGESPAKADIVNRLRQYIRKVFLINPQAEFSVSLPFDIQSLLICE